MATIDMRALDADANGIVDWDSVRPTTVVWGNLNRY